MKLRRVLTTVAAVALAFGLGACADIRGNGVVASPTPDASVSPTQTAAPTQADIPTPSSTPARGDAGGLIGIALPTKSLERWSKDGAHLAAVLEGMGYTTTLQYADNEPDRQVSQIKTMIGQKPKVLVIATLGGAALPQVLRTAVSKGITVIAYDRMIYQTKNVDYYVTFDNYRVGQLQGRFIEDQLGLKDGKGPFNLEPFAGSPDDAYAAFFFAGAWDVLKPYVKNKQLVCPSKKCPAGDDDWASIGIQGWDSDEAQSEMRKRLRSHYLGGKKVDAVLAPNDSLALGIEQALDDAGYKPGTNWPIVTGQDADLDNVKNILAGEQSMTVWKDTSLLGDEVGKMVDQIVKGETVDVNDTDSYNNGTKTVPSFLIQPDVVTQDTVESLLVAKGFYTKDQLGLP